MSTKRPRRKAIPMSVKQAILWRQQNYCADGCGATLQPELAFTYTQLKTYLGRIRFDHRPPLALRPLNEDGTDYDPPQLDPRYIDALTPECHDKRTFKGRSGATSVGSDAHAIAKTRRILKGGCKRKGRKMRSAGFQKPPKGYKHKWPKRSITRTHRRIGSE